MSFQQSSNSWRSKAHLGGMRLPLLVGITAIAICLVVIAALCLVNVASSDGLTIVSDEEAADEGSDESSEEEGGEEEGEEGSGTVIVYVTGAVAVPGVCELSEGSRVQDAIEAVGGFSDEAATDALNLARLLEDGEQIDVPTLEEQAEAEAAGEELSTSGDEAGSSSSSSSTSAEGLININTASAEELEELPGIGEVTAEKIIADREANGDYATIEDITRVSGIGDKKFEAISELICV